MLWKYCTQYAGKSGKLSSGHRTGKVNFHSNPKERQSKEYLNYRITGLISHANKVMLLFGTLHSDECIFPFLPCLSHLFFSQLFLRPPQTTILPFCISFSWGWSWILPLVQCHESPSIVLQALYQIWSFESISHFHCIIVRDSIWVILEWSSGFPHFLQFKSEFGSKEFTIWATVSFWSCFCWLYRASPSLAAKNIVNLILVLTIWWCPCVVSSLTLLKEGAFYDQCILLAKLY